MGAHRTFIGGVLIWIALVLTGCGGKPDLQQKDSRAAPSATAAAPDTEKSAAATQRALKAAATDSPEATVLTLWRRMQQRLVQLAQPEYSRRVVNSLGEAAVQGGLREQQAFFSTSTPRIASRERTEIGEALTVRALLTDGRTIDHSYVVRRESGGWRIIYDSVLEDGLAAYGRRNAEFSSAGRRAVEAAGIAIAERYRLLSTPRADADRNGSQSAQSP